MVKVLPDNLELSLIPSDTLVCVGDSVVIVSQLEPNWTMAQITWYDENFNPIVSSDTLVDFPFAGLNTYFAIADNGCVMDTAQVSVFGEQLELDITGSEGNICPGEEVQLLVTGCDDCTYTWEPAGSLDDPTVSDPIATPQQTTGYTVAVMGRACVEELSTTVTVECLECPINRLFMPTAFTPNGDGNNDYVCLRSEDFDRFDEISLMYYNRWGQEVYRQRWVGNPNDPNDKPDPDFFCWDGRFDGEILPPEIQELFSPIWRKIRI